MTILRCVTPACRSSTARRITCGNKIQMPLCSSTDPPPSRYPHLYLRKYGSSGRRFLNIVLLILKGELGIRDAPPQLAPRGYTPSPWIRRTKELARVDPTRSGINPSDQSADFT